MIINSPIATERLLLRNLTEADVTESYFSWLNDPEVLRYLEARFYKLGHIKELCAFVKKVNESSDTLMLGIFIKDTNRHIGNIKLGPINFQHSRAEIGFLIGDRKSWKLGYASEAIQAVSQFGMYHLNLAKISAGCYETNVGSKKALLNAGFTQVATIPNNVVSDGVRVGSLMFALDR
jgi:ribosomal-protein-alanine N-acetyltransferase